MTRRPKYSKDLVRLLNEITDKVHLVDLRQYGGNMSPRAFNDLVREALLEHATKAAEYVWPGFMHLMQQIIEKDLELDDLEQGKTQKGASA